jgi:hypothetical protein
MDFIPRSESPPGGRRGWPSAIRHHPKASLVSAIAVFAIIVSQLPIDPVSRAKQLLLPGTADAAARSYGQFAADVICRPFPEHPEIAVPAWTPVGESHHLQHMLATKQVIYEFFPTIGKINIYNRSQCVVHFRMKVFEITRPIGHPGRYAEQLNIFNQVVAIKPGEGMQISAENAKSHDGTPCAAQLDFGNLEGTKDFAGYEQNRPENGTAHIPLCVNDAPPPPPSSSSRSSACNCPPSSRSSSAASSVASMQMPSSVASSTISYPTMSSASSMMSYPASSASSAISYPPMSSASSAMSLPPHYGGWPPPYHPQPSWPSPQWPWGQQGWNWGQTVTVTPTAWTNVNNQVNAFSGNDTTLWQSTAPQGSGW